MLMFFSPFYLKVFIAHIKINDPSISQVHNRKSYPPKTEEFKEKARYSPANENVAFLHGRRQKARGEKESFRFGDYTYQMLRQV